MTGNTKQGDNVVDLDQLLYGTCTDAEVTEFFRDGSWDNEPYLIQAIEKHLLTEEQRATLYYNHMSIQKMLNGMTVGAQSNIKADIYKQWNEKLGFKCFGA